MIGWSQFIVKPGETLDISAYDPNYESLSLIHNYWDYPITTKRVLNPSYTELSSIIINAYSYPLYPLCRIILWKNYRTVAWNPFDIGNFDLLEVYLCFLRCLLVESRVHVMKLMVIVCRLCIIGKNTI